MIEVARKQPTLSVLHRLALALNQSLSAFMYRVEQRYQELAEVLNVPTPYLYAMDDSMARMIVAFGMLSEDEKAEALEFVERAAGIAASESP